MSRYVRVVSLWIHPRQEAAFGAFEQDAARIVARHGGRIDAAVGVGGAGEEPFEAHVRAAAESYAADSETVELRPRRAEIIARTEVLAGFLAGPYSG